MFLRIRRCAGLHREVEVAGMTTAGHGPEQMGGLRADPLQQPLVARVEPHHPGVGGDAGQFGEVGLAEPTVLVGAEQHHTAG